MEVFGKDDGPEVATIEKIHVFRQAESTTSIHDRLNCGDPPEGFGDNLNTRAISSQMSASRPSLVKRKHFLLSSGIFILITVGLLITIAIVLTRHKKYPM